MPQKITLCCVLAVIALGATTYCFSADEPAPAPSAIKDTQAEFGPDAYLDGKVSLAARKNLREKLTEIDPAVVKPGTFWFGELQNLDANAG